MTIPASAIANSIPGVLSSGGNPLALNGLFLTESLLMPTGQVLGFVSQPAVANFFGPASAEAAAALIYFAGYTNATAKPNAMLFAPYNAAARSAWVQSGSLAAMSLTALKALAAGTITITLDGASETSSSINLSGVASFTAAATLIAAAFATAPIVAWNAVNSTFTITSHTTDTTSIVTVTTGTLATALNLTAATGALSSLGAPADTPSSAMATAVAISQNWATMVTLFEPTLADKLLFTAWFNAQSNRYAYLGWDSDVQASVQGATEPFGVVISSLNSNGVVAIGGDPAAVPSGSTLAALVMNTAIFLSGAVASINFSQAKGRRSIAFLAQSGLTPTCANEQTSANLLANGYSFYGSYASANQGFVFFYNGQMPGEYVSLTRFINQVWMNNQFQLALMTLITQVGSVGYDPEDYELIRAALTDPITAAVTFGAIRTGVVLSPAQILEVNLAANTNAASVIQSQGYYLQILDPGATARANGTTPIINFWYTDGGDILLLSLASIDIQ